MGFVVVTVLYVHQHVFQLVLVVLLSVIVVGIGVLVVVVVVVVVAAAAAAVVADPLLNGFLLSQVAAAVDVHSNPHTIIRVIKQKDKPCYFGERWP